MNITRLMGSATFAALLAGAPIAAPAADDATVVRVSLLDMSAVMGKATPGQGYGPGMMGQGQGYGPGMMGQGQSQGYGPGMMGQGQYGQGGMMGGGMMGGQMSIHASTATVKAGKVHFEVANLSKVMEHEMLVVATDGSSAALPYDPASARVPEDKIKSLGEVSELKPNGTGTLDLQLSPGTYLLFCNIAGHYAAGMYTVLTVTP